MSLITDVVIVAMYPEDEAIAHVNGLLAADGSFKGQQIRPLNMDSAGGFKVISACVYAAAFNYGDISSLQEYLMAAPWKCPEDVTICVDREGEGERLFPRGPQRRGAGDS